MAMKFQVHTRKKNQSIKKTKQLKQQYQNHQSFT